MYMRWLCSSASMTDTRKLCAIRYECCASTGAPFHHKRRLAADDREKVCDPTEICIQLALLLDLLTTASLLPSCVDRPSLKRVGKGPSFDSAPDRRHDAPKNTLIAPAAKFLQACPVQSVQIAPEFFCSFCSELSLC
jgi:hypothetical protein